MGGGEFETISLDGPDSYEWQAVFWTWAGKSIPVRVSGTSYDDGIKFKKYETRGFKLNENERKVGPSVLGRFTTIRDFIYNI